MENDNQPLDLDLSGSARQRETSLEITPKVRSAMKELSGWMFFLSILMFLGAIMLLIFVAFGLNTLSQMPYANLERMDVLLVLGIAFIISSLIAYPAWCYYQFSSKTRLALTYSDAGTLEDASLWLKRFYRFSGIMLLLTIGIF
ncbi:MAG: hypothetical protein IT269_03000, partial [Saprospiraceae bacterium]|nr:hypothetical protein [Saprospiraceae bacterium]